MYLDVYRITFSLDLLSDIDGGKIFIIVVY